MKIEMCESLFYSWLRHVKGCQLVQTNWKPSPQWTVENREKVEEPMRETDVYFQSKYGYTAFNGCSLSQLMSQAKPTLVGISLNDGQAKVYSVETAVLKAELNGKTINTAKTIKKWVSSVLNIVGCFNTMQGEFILPAPTANSRLLNDLNICADEINKLLAKNGLNFSLCVIAEEEFKSEVLSSVFEISETVNDTAELFLQSLQLINGFICSDKTNDDPITSKTTIDNDEYVNYKVGQIANRVLRMMLQNNAASAVEVGLMQNKDYSKTNFGIDFPLLVRYDGNYDRSRYYKTPLYIYGKKYMLCSQWFEQTSNNDREPLLMWIETHK
ncbi:MAG: hypothetical protein K2J79_06880, partial [Ruminiclostridium sp.]|nr:hypothetical protein [Ruminiclostridium sp.]